MSLSPLESNEAPWAWDGSAEALLFLADKAFRQGRWPGSLVGPQDDEGDLFTAVSAALPAIEPGLTERAAEHLRGSCELLHGLALEAWMSEEGVEAELLEVASLVGRDGLEAAEDYSRPAVRALRAACYRVGREIHRLEGLARFSLRRDGLYSAPLEPDHNVLAALLPYFTRRFGSQAFALVDRRRQIAFESRGGLIAARAGDEALALLPDRADEEEVLWRRYFAAIDNPSRRNLELQRRLMPARYWRNLPELAPEAAIHNRGENA
jgi:probable DNA metabolism protein